MAEKKEKTIGIIDPNGYLRDNKVMRGGVSPTILAENDKLRVLRKLKRNAIKSESLTKADLKRSTGCIEDSVVQPLPQGIIRML